MSDEVRRVPVHLPHLGILLGIRQQLLLFPSTRLNWDVGGMISIAM